MITCAQDVDIERIESLALGIDDDDDGDDDGGDLRAHIEACSSCREIYEDFLEERALFARRADAIDEPFLAPDVVDAAVAAAASATQQHPSIYARPFTFAVAGLAAAAAVLLLRPEVSANVHPTNDPTTLAATTIATADGTVSPVDLSNSNDATLCETHAHDDDGVVQTVNANEGVVSAMTSLDKIASLSPSHSRDSELACTSSSSGSASSTSFAMIASAASHQAHSQHDRCEEIVTSSFATP